MVSRDHRHRKWARDQQAAAAAPERLGPMPDNDAVVFAVLLVLVCGCGWRTVKGDVERKDEEARPEQPD